MTRSALIPTLALCLLLTSVVAGCGGSHDSANKAGAAVSKSRTITIQAPDPGDPETVYLAKRITERSGATLHVRIGDQYDSRLVSNEFRLGRDVRAGRVGFALLAGRAWAGAGVPAFAAVNAPFVVTTYDAARAAMAGPAGKLLSSSLSKAGVEPLAIFSTQLRRLLATRSLTTPAGFRGAKLRIIDSSTTAGTLKALGAQPEEGYASTDVLPALQSGRLDGAESAPRPILGNNYGAVAHRLTGYALFDKVVTFVASPAALKGLSADQQKALRDAGADLVAYASKEASLEADDVGRLCRDGVKVDNPTAGELSALVSATASVRDGLARDPAAGPVLRLLQKTPGAGAHPLPPPSACNGTAKPAPSTSAAKAGIPTGTYSVTLTPKDFHHYGTYGEIANRPRENLTTFNPDGRFTYEIRPEFGPALDRCPCSGNYKVAGNRVTFDWDRADWPDDRASWSYYAGKLTFTDIDVSDPADTVYYVAHPWRKVR
jgi:TRAP-type transport system periplasmic protein